MGLSKGRVEREEDPSYLTQPRRKLPKVSPKVKQNRAEKGQKHDLLDNASTEVTMLRVLPLPTQGLDQVFTRKVPPERRREASRKRPQEGKRRLKTPPFPSQKTTTKLGFHLGTEPPFGQGASASSATACAPYPITP